MPAGRPTDFKNEFCEEARILCEGGATDEEVAKALDIHVSTLYRWKARFPQFSEALKAGKAAADDRVELSLYHKAIGYKHAAVKIFMPAGADAPVYAPYTEHVPPDTTAAIFWLKNRRPDLWRDKSEQVIRHEHVTALADDELERIAARGSEGAVAAPVNPPKPH